MGDVGLKGTDRMAITHLLRRMLQFQAATIVNISGGGKDVITFDGGLRAYIPFVHYSGQDMFLLHPAYDAVSLYERIVDLGWFLVPAHRLNLGEPKQTFAKGYKGWDMFYLEWISK